MITLLLNIIILGLGDKEIGLIRPELDYEGNIQKYSLKMYDGNQEYSIYLHLVDIQYKNNPTQLTPEVTFFKECEYIKAESHQTDEVDSLGFHQTKITRGKLVIISGMDPVIFEHLMKKETPRDKINRFYLTLVEVGMTDPSYTTRQAATNILVRAEEKAIPALKIGMISNNLEIKTRCESALFKIKTGFGE